jgi:ParB family chromosome partitioning protein
MLKRIPLDKIFGNPEQPRKDFDPKALQELAQSIDQNGLMQPITVVPKGEGTFMIVAGERRWRAHCLLQEQGKAQDILAHVRKMNEDEVAVNAIVENLSRADISPLEEAHAFQAMLDRGYSVEDLAKKLGISQPRRISDRTSLLKLDETILPLVRSGDISTHEANWIATLPHHQQRDIVRLISSGKIRGIQAIRAAVQAKQDAEAQSALFGDMSETSPADLQTLSRMEKKIESVVSMVSAGWKDGECVIAAKVDRNRAEQMADKLKLAQQHIAKMEKALREIHAQAEIFSSEAA